MEYLELQSALAIMERVAAYDGQLTWYTVVKSVDQLGLEKIPSSYDVLKALAHQGLLRLDPPEGGNFARYWLTDMGRQYLRRHGARPDHKHRKRSTVQRRVD
jgi:hypothetical protein